MLRFGPDRRAARRLAPFLLTLLAACDGEPEPPPPPPTHPVRIEVSGLAGPGLVVGMRGGDVETSRTIDADGAYAFDEEVAEGEPITVWIEEPPGEGACEVEEGERASGPALAPVPVRCVAPPAVCEGLFVAPDTPVRFEPVFTDLPPWSLEGEPERFTFTTLRQAPGDDRYWYLVAREGVVWRFENRPDVDSAEVLLDIRERVHWERDDGLVSLAFHPDFEDNGWVFVQYALYENRARVSRFTRLGDGPAFDPDSEAVLFEVQRDTRLHVGGTLHFGDDGHLYGSMGDGGSSEEPHDNAQELDSLLGTMFRVDVDVGPDADPPYRAPPDNPFGAEGERAGEGRPEIWAWGLRNLYRWSFDPVTGEAWGGDVGQMLAEEVNHLRRGHNYGWPFREGADCYPPDGTVTDCRAEGLTPPAHEYGRDDGASITGGRVYRGSAVPALYGAYLFGDFVSQRMWALADPYGARRVVPLGETGIGIVDVAVDQDGEILLLGLPSSRILRMVPDEGSTRDAVPERLAETGCMREDTPTEPAEGFVPYAINAPLWSDGATKRRWISVPEGGEVRVGEDGDLALPVGTVLAKEFSLDGRRLETRFLVHRAPGQWAGYSYRWDAGETEATLVAAPETEDLADQTWLYPGPGQCMQCHTAAAGRSLGLEVGQLDRTVDVDGAPTPQLERLVAAGVLAEVPSGFDAYPRIDDPDPAAAARAYLHANCAHCHRPEHTVRVSLDLRLGTPMADTGACAPPLLDDLGLADARIVTPGAPERSVLLARMRALNGARMPRLATSVVDEAATAVVESWIADHARCP
ncbi:MAG TPA: PQQ-dependent sugar dehydrogenase [Sandaracinaceae bacterium LLY-WYZ-13_1]|nr:PQQ-dependent sugar dehydrogenase [Sandaracinaceae bacterium LLY-WYZ-13_1]